MGSAMAIVSKAVFEKLAKAKGRAELGDVLGIDRYASTHATLHTLAEGGSLFLVTVRPPDEALWLVGVLDNPEQRDDGWYAAPSTAPITDVSGAKAKLEFTTGAGITAKPGALGMSLQTPRALTDDDATLLRGGGKAPKAAPATSSKTTAKSKSKPTKTKAAKQASKVSSDDNEAGDILEPLREALADRDGAAALAAALAAWRTTRSPALADLIDAISERISSPPTETEAAWSKIAAAKDPLDLGALLPGIRSLPASFLRRAGEQLAAFPDDPRIAGSARAWILEPPTTSSSTYPFWTKLLDAIARSGDTRVIATIKKRLKQAPPRNNDSWRTTPSQFWGRYYAALRKVLAKLEATAPVTVKLDGKLAKQITALDTVAPGPAPAKRGKTPKVAGAPLAQASVHAASGRIVDAIDALLVAWRATKAPELANAIDRATRLLPTYDRPFPVEAKAAHAAWEAAFAADPATALPQLVQHINAGGAAAAENHLLALASLPDDPRIGIRLAELACNFQISPERTQYWKTLWELYARTADVRGNAVLRVHFHDFTGTYYNHHRQGRRLAGDFVLGATTPTLDAGGHAALNIVLGALDGLAAVEDRTERELIAAIVDDWADDGPRIVYADWLSDRGHPRGEAIVLSCKRSALSPAESKRLDALIGGVRNPAYVFGPFSDLTFDLDRGLPGRIQLAYNSSSLTWRRLVGHPLLPALETIDMRELNDERGQPFPDDLAPVLLDPTAVRLTRVDGVPRTLAEPLVPLVKAKWKLDGNALVRR